MRRLGFPIAVLLALLAAPAASIAKQPPDVIRVGGPSGPDEPKVAIVGSRHNLSGKRFVVTRAGSGKVVDRARLHRAPGKPAPFRHAYEADWSKVSEPGRYRIRVGRLNSPRWTVEQSGTKSSISAILHFFQANRDGDLYSPVHGPSHLHDAVVHPDAPAHAGERIDMTGGWMDAGDTLHFTQTTAFAASLLQAAARIDPSRAALSLDVEALVGVKWLLKAHPAPDLFIAQVGDERDHEIGFRDPARDDASGKPGIGTRFAYPEIGGDLGGKAATALALAYRRWGTPEFLAAAREWYEAGKASGRAARPLRKAGYPQYTANFYVGSRWEDSLAAGAVELYRATCAAGACENSYLSDFRTYIAGEQSRAGGDLGVVDAFAPFAAADACGAFGDPALPGDAGSIGCDLLRRNGEIAVRRAQNNAFGMPGYFSWGTTATNGGSGALAALATATPQGLRDGCEVAAGARDYLLGRNPWGAGFVVGFRRKPAKHPHHWGAAIAKRGVPFGAVVGGPAPRGQVEAQGFEPRSKFDSRGAVYEDKRRDYVTSEPAIDYAADSILLLAAVAARCS